MIRDIKEEIQNTIKIKPLMRKKRIGNISNAMSRNKIHNC